MSARPATAPTTLPTSVGVDGEPPPPDAAATVDDDAGMPSVVAVGPPAPPSPFVASAVFDTLAEDEVVDCNVVEDENDELMAAALDGVRSVEFKEGVVDVWLEVVGKVSDKDEGERVEVKLELGVTMTGKVVTLVDPEIVCDDVTTAADQYKEGKGRVWTYKTWRSCLWSG